jgi:hypothetical protein
MRKLIAASIAIAFTLVPATAKAPADPRAVIAKSLTQTLRDDFTKHSNKQIKAAIKPVDINADGIQDWQVDFNAFGAAWCGTGGCRYQLWLGQRNGKPIRVFDRQMRSLEIVKRGRRVVFVFDFHGGQCGTTGAEACPGEFTWSPKRARMVLLPTPAKHTAVQEPIQPFD